MSLRTTRKGAANFRKSRIEIERQQSTSYQEAIEMMRKLALDLEAGELGVKRRERWRCECLAMASRLAIMTGLE